MKIILLIGKIASGKTTYARKLGGMLISCDQLMQSMFPGGCGERHDVLAERARKYLFDLARQCTEAGVMPVVDFGFWTPAMRQEAIDALSGCELEWHYLDISAEEWRRRIEGRNAAILAGQGSPSDYFVDEGLLQKVNSLFVPPTEEELPGLIVVRE